MREQYERETVIVVSGFGTVLFLVTFLGWCIALRNLFQLLLT